TSLERFARERGASLYMLLLTAFALLLGRYSGQERIAVGTPVANRPRPELEPLIGFFANTLALPIDLQGEPSFAQLLERVREQVLAALQHQQLPFEKLVEQLRPARDLARSPLFQ